MTITIMTKATTTYSAIKPIVSNMSNIRKSVANIQHTRHIRSAIAAMLITYDKHPPLMILFRAFFNILYDKLDKLVRQCQAVNSHLQITETCKYDIQAVTNQILMIENPESQRSPEIFLE